VLTPLAYQRAHWDDEGNFREHDELGLAIDASDREEVAAYPFKGGGMEAFATQAAGKERFLRTILQTHFIWYFGREMRYEAEERGFYKKLWDVMGASNYKIKPLIRAIVLSPEYLNGSSQTPSAQPKIDEAKKRRGVKIALLHQK
jgi:hypothetical protein